MSFLSSIHLQKSKTAKSWNSFDFKLNLLEICAFNGTPIASQIHRFTKKLNNFFYFIHGILIDQARKVLFSIARNLLIFIGFNHHFSKKKVLYVLRFRFLDFVGCSIVKFYWKVYWKYWRLITKASPRSTWMIHRENSGFLGPWITLKSKIELLA